MKACSSVLVFFAILVLLPGLEAHQIPRGNGNGQEPPKFWEMRMRLPKTYSKESRHGFKKTWPRSMCGKRFAPC